MAKRIFVYGRFWGEQDNHCIGGCIGMGKGMSMIWGRGVMFSGCICIFRGACYLTRRFCLDDLDVSDGTARAFRYF